MNIYVASSWRCEWQPAVVAALREAGYEVYDFRNPPGNTGFHWSSIDPHVWWKPSSLDLIRQSAEELKRWANSLTEWTFYLPRPGCQNGGLKWSEVEPVLRSVGLPDNVVVVTNDERQWKGSKCKFCGESEADLHAHAVEDYYVAD